MRALLSVANRDGLSAFARELQALGVELFATDGTREHLAADGIEAASVSDLTAVPPLVGGQVRTFHPAIYAGILARRDRPDQLEQLVEHGIGLIDIVVVNVKPFAPEVGRRHIGIDEAIEMIDVAGAALLGAAARNAAGVIAVPAPAHYPTVLEELRSLGQVSADTRYRLAADAFSTVAAYYAEIAAYLNQIGNNVYPQRLALVLEKVARPALRREPAPARRVLPRDHAPLRQPRGRDAARRGAADVQQPARPRRRLPDRDRLHGAHGRHRQAHGPGGHRVGRGAGRGLPARARHRPGVLVRRHRRREPRARRRDGARDRRELVRGGDRARVLAGGARDPARQARPRAARRARVARWRACATTASRTSTSSASAAGCWSRRSTRSTSTAASSRSSPDATRPWASSPTCCSPGGPSATCARTRSCSRATARRSASAPRRRAGTRPVDIALRRAGDRAKLAVMASDAYFPFPDGIQIAANAGVTAIIQPGGSIRDEMAIEVADRHHLAMVFTGRRHFRH